MIHNDIKVKSEIEGHGGSGAGKFPIRFWLEMPVNGKTAMSRGTVIEVEKQSLEDARRFARVTAAKAQSRLYHWILDQGIDNVTPKDAANQLPMIIDAIMQDEADFLDVIENGIHGV